MKGNFIELIGQPTFRPGATNALEPFPERLGYCFSLGFAGQLRKGRRQLFGFLAANI